MVGTHLIRFLSLEKKSSALLRKSSGCIAKVLHFYEKMITVQKKLCTFTEKPSVYRKSSSLSRKTRRFHSKSFAVPKNLYTALKYPSGTSTDFGVRWECSSARRKSVTPPRRGWPLEGDGRCTGRSGSDARLYSPIGSAGRLFRSRRRNIRADLHRERATTSTCTLVVWC